MKNTVYSYKIIYTYKKQNIAEYMHIYIYTLIHKEDRD